MLGIEAGAILGQPGQLDADLRLRVGDPVERLADVGEALIDTGHVAGLDRCRQRLERLEDVGRRAPLQDRVAVERHLHGAVAGDVDRLDVGVALVGRDRRPR